jgi:hypothetical protein
MTCFATPQSSATNVSPGANLRASVRRKNRQRRRKSTRKSFCTDTEEGETIDDEPTTSNKEENTTHTPSALSSIGTSGGMERQQSHDMRQQAAHCHSQGIPVDLNQLFGIDRSPQTERNTSVQNIANAQSINRSTTGLNHTFSPELAQLPVFGVTQPLSTHLQQPKPMQARRRLLGSVQEAHHVSGVFNQKVPSQNGLYTRGPSANGAMTSSLMSLASLRSPPARDANRPVIELCNAWKNFRLDRSKLHIVSMWTLLIFLFHFISSFLLYLIAAELTFGWNIWTDKQTTRKEGNILQ